MAVGVRLRRQIAQPVPVGWRAVATTTAAVLRVKRARSARRAEVGAGATLRNRFRGSPEAGRAVLAGRGVSREAPEHRVAVTLCRGLGKPVDLPGMRYRVAQTSTGLQQEPV